MASINAQVVEKDKNIQDYFALIKAEWICDFHDSYKKIIDVRNGYIAFSTSENELEPIFQMALFKGYREKDVVVIHLPGYACGDIFACPTTENRRTYFLKYENEGWVDVSHVVLPQIAIEQFYQDSNNTNIVIKHAPHAINYELPRFGLTIRLKLEICEDYINFDYPDNPIVSDEQIDKLLKERKVLFLKWNKRLGVFQMRE